MNNNAIFSGVWAIQETALSYYMEWWRRVVESGRDAVPLFADGQLMQAAVGHAANRQGSVAIVPIYGPISQKSSLFQRFMGGASTEGIEANVASAVNDPNVKAVVLDIDSPGGSVYGVEQAGDTIRSLRGRKPIVAIANSLAASAAYWIGAQADEFYASPGAEVGSVGVFAMHLDVSGMLEKEGVKVSFIKAGKYKTDGNPYEPLSDDARADAQASVDRYHADFVKALAAGRGVAPSTVRDKFGDGKVFGGEDAKARGMIDRVGTMSELLGRLGAAVPNQRRKADMLRRRLELRKAQNA